MGEIEERKDGTTRKETTRRRKRSLGKVNEDWRRRKLDDNLKWWQSVLNDRYKINKAIKKRGHRNSEEIITTYFR